MIGDCKILKGVPRLLFKESNAFEKSIAISLHSKYFIQLFKFVITYSTCALDLAMYLVQCESKNVSWLRTLHGAVLYELRL